MTTNSEGGCVRKFAEGAQIIQSLPTCIYQKQRGCMEQYHTASLL
jgi:hypothetical protein